MKKARDDARDIEIHLGEGIGGFQGMNKVGFSGKSHLPLMRLGGEDVCPLKQFHIGVGVVPQNLVNDVVKPYHTYSMYGTRPG